jgi:archaellin
MSFPATIFIAMLTVTAVLAAALLHSGGVAL